MADFVERRASVSGSTILRIGLVLGFVGLCAWPYLGWFAHPSLFDDDLLRVGSLRRSTLGALLFRPFNEHMAPLFETASWIAWQASRGDLLTVPLAFQVSSYLALALTIGLLALVAHRELRSPAATMVCVAVFGLSAVAAETVLWFSASSFEWSAAALLGAWYASIRAAEASRIRSRALWLMAASLASLAAPAFSAIGILAGPVATFRFLVSRDRRDTLVRWVVWSLAPVGGTVVYLLICQQFAYGTVLASSVHQNLELRAAIWATVQAPAAVLLPAAFGQDSLIRRLPGPILAGATLVGLVVGLVVGFRSRQRGLILGGLALIMGGYLATYATRARPGDLDIFEVQRYHLFPQVGLALLIGALFRPFLTRPRQTPTTRLFAVICLTGLLAIAQYPRMRAASDRSFRYPDQPRALAATLRLEAICDREGITLVQAIETLDPVQTPWFPKRGSFPPHLYLFASGPQVPRLPTEQVRPLILSSLSIDDREAIFGGLDGSRYRLTSDFPVNRGVPVECRLVGSQRMVATGSNQYRAGGRGSWLDFEVDPSAGSARALLLPDLVTTNNIEIWWAGADGEWSPYRSLRWKPEPGATRGIALDRLPHWRANFVRKLRLVIREWGPVTVGPPRFVP